MKKESIMVDRLGGIDPLSRYNASQKTKRTINYDSKDSVEFSNEARLKADLLKIGQEIKKAPESNFDKIEEAKLEIEDSSFINSKEVLNKTIDKIFEDIKDFL